MLLAPKAKNAIPTSVDTDQKIKVVRCAALDGESLRTVFAPLAAAIANSNIGKIIIFTG